MPRKRRVRFTTLTPAQRAVHAFLKARGPLTDAELIALYAVTPGHLAQTPSGLRTRRSELVKKGYVVAGLRVQSAQGRPARRWRAV